MVSARRFAKQKSPAPDTLLVNSDPANTLKSFFSVSSVVKSPQGSNRRCSFRMQRSITTKIPASRAFSAAASWTTPSCIQIAGTFS